MTLNAIVVSACLTIFSTSSLLANATSVGALTDLSKEIGPSMELTMNSAMDSDCKAHFKQFPKLRDSNIIFTTDKHSVTAYPAWPLVCSYAVMADKVAVNNLSRGDREIQFSRTGESEPYLTIVLQQITDDEQDGFDYQMVKMNNQDMVQPKQQKLVMNIMLDYYHHVVGQ